MSTLYDLYADHLPDCENHRYYQCSDPTCELVPDSLKNYCSHHGRYIPRATECICERLSYVEDERKMRIGRLRNGY